ncbi:prenyltransferase/squalene oxidase repeat-containing protein [Thermomonospora amylolytica]|uniref:prenyltransferase/squalene oxidase repeat-containing protein n=1 Tax=Thermomonospora amylolytica TaxID=1411117 RepID=UPI001F235EC3|nr:prenyltransferase/squalene oxidase repeat-containing protein [Thermomonospora amylolytica]
MIDHGLPRTATGTPRTDPGIDIAASADELVNGLLEHPWGQVTPSVYETGRLVGLAPWLALHDERVRYLVRTQRPDGGWGAPHRGYALVPTLSAVEALLAELRRGPADRSGPRKAVDRGLTALGEWLEGGGPPIPDMPAVELIVPVLIDRINDHLEHLDGGPSGRRLVPPAGMDDAKAALIGSLVRAGADLPDKLWHALEIAGDAAAGARGTAPEHTGTIGASPAATAAWLGPAEPPPHHPARRYLETAARAHGGPVPCGLPITVFERGWVLSWLIRAGVPVRAPERLVRELREAIGPAGAPAAAGLPADADTTSAALYALALAGAPHPPDVLWGYETPTHFCTWRGEDGRSITTNAHVLEAFGRHLATVRGPAERYAATVAKVAGWLCEQQLPDGQWTDRWHASPYYATACAAPALARFGGPGRARRSSAPGAGCCGPSGRTAHGACGRAPRRRPPTRCTSCC